MSAIPAETREGTIALSDGRRQGELDVLAPHAHGRRVAERLPNATFELVGGKGHMLYDAWAEAFASATR